MKNRYDVILFILAASTCFGNLGGALQVDRLLAILFSPILLYTIQKVGYGYAISIMKVLGMIFLYMCLSFVWTPDREEAFKELFYYPVHFVLLLEIIVFSRLAHKPLKSISRGWLCAVILSSIVAYWEITTGNHLSIAKEVSETHNMGGGDILQHMTASVTFNNYNSYVTFLCFSFPWLFYIILDSERGIVEKTLSIAALIVLSIIIIINASRGGLLAILVMLSCYVLMSRKSRMKTMLLFSIILVTVYLLLSYGEAITAVMASRASGGGLFEDEARSVIWLNALKTFADTWGFGVGIGGIHEGMAKFAQGGITVTHNMILEILVQYGIVITIVVILFLWRMFKRTFKITDKTRKVVLVMTFFAMPAYLIIDSGYLLNVHFYVFIATIFVFTYYERIKLTNQILRPSA